jgi:plastocyanin
MRRTATLICLVAMISAACGGEQQSTPPETTTTAPLTTTTEAEATTTAAADDEAPTLSITIAGFRFSGDDTGAVGETVQVTNSDSVGHTWTATDGAFHSGVIGSGETFNFTFEEPGTYPYFCQIHPEMSGTITIDG